MGLLDWFRREAGNVEVASDRIWLTKRAKLAGIRSDVARALAGTNAPYAFFLVAHFRDCLDELRSLADGMECDDGALLVTRADALEGRSAPGMSFDGSRIVHVLVGERHPLPSHDEAVLEFARGLPSRCYLVHHVSLEDPVLRLFSSEWVDKILKQLGMSEDEAIESHVVTRRLRAAQQKIASHASGDISADSAEDWLDRNCPELWRKSGAQFGSRGE